MRQGKAREIRITHRVAQGATTEHWGNQGEAREDREYQDMKQWQQKKTRKIRMTQGKAGGGR